ncbi:MAG: carbohydrate kinase [Acidobacteria bacterium]|nr:carbohydrate kinase [Acidobacteriota bacterium]
MNAERLQALVSRFPACRVAVLGDFFLDKYLDVDATLAEVSIETGRTAHQVVSVRCSPGAAGTVVNNLAALGAGAIHTLGVIGDDGEGYELRRALEGTGCDVSGLIVQPGRFTPTYLKPRDRRIPGLAGEHERYDTKNRRPTPPEVERRLLDHLGRLLPGLDAVIVLDQVEEADCGAVTANVRAGLARLADAHPETLFWADSRRRIGLFRGLTVKVNEGEAVGETGGTEDEERKAENAEGAASSGGWRVSDDELVRRAIAQLRARTGKPVFVTAGARGTWVSDPEPLLVPAVRIEGPIDPTGAGDSATAGAVLALCAGATLEEAALVANLVASITIEQLATTGTASPPDLAPRLERWLGQRIA